MHQADTRPPPEVDVSVVLPNYNGEHLLRKNLPAVVQALERFPGTAEVVVTDDASTDASVETLQRDFSRVRIVAHESNRGFAAAVMSGVLRAQGRVVILLNTDVRPAADFIAPLVRHFAESDVFSVSPVAIEQNGAPHPLSWNRKCFRRGELKSMPWTLDEALSCAERGCESLFASGGSMAVRRTMFLELGGFLDIFAPFYSEDLELGIRAWRCGLRTLFEPRSRIVHEHGGTISKTYHRHFVNTIQRRNGFLVLWIHCSPGTLILRLFPRGLLRLVSRLLSVDRSYLHGLYLALGLVPRVLGLRRELSRQHADWQPFETVLWRLCHQTRQRDDGSRRRQSVASEDFRGP